MRGGCFVALQQHVEVCDSFDYSDGVGGTCRTWGRRFCLRRVWCFMLMKARMTCIAMYEDNEGVIQIAINPISNSNS